MRSSIAKGTLIVTSGLGGTFPRGIPVGVVISEVKTPELWARTYLLRPAVSPADLSSVMVLLPDRLKAGVEPVWKDARGDSVPVADSLAHATGGHGGGAHREGRARQRRRGQHRAQAPPQVPARLDRGRGESRGAPRQHRAARAGRAHGHHAAARTMRSLDAFRVLIAFLVLVLLQYTVRPMLGWQYGPDFLLVALLVVAVRVRPGTAAAIGLLVGLVSDSIGTGPFGAASLAMAVVAFGASWLQIGRVLR